MEKMIIVVTSAAIGLMLAGVVGGLVVGGAALVGLVIVG